MIDKIREYIASQKMLKKGDGIIVGVSGGADSVCLLFVLWEIAKKDDYKLRAIHVHHGLRESADRDEEYVRKICADLNVPLRVQHVDVKGYSEEKKLGTEEAGRILRYGIFEEERVSLKEKLQEQNGEAYIAVAHHMNDNAETLLLHLFRGSGLHGLGGIAPVSGTVIRPLLCVSREEIEEYLSLQNIPFCTDETNLTDDYTRNRLRNHVLPYAESEIYRGAMKNTAQAAERLRKADAYLGRIAEEIKSNLVSFRDGEVVISDAYVREDEVFDSYILTDIIESLSGCRKDITCTHISEFRRLFSLPDGSRLSLPYGITAYKDRLCIVFGSETKGKTAGADTEYHFPKELTEGMEYRIELPEVGSIVFRLFSEEESQRKRTDIPLKTYTKWFDYDKIDEHICLRHRKTGDMLSVLDNGGCKKLKDYLINEHVPARKRDDLFLLADGNDVLWIIGYRIGSAYKVTEETKRIIEIAVEYNDLKGNSDEGTGKGII